MRLRLTAVVAAVLLLVAVSSPAQRRRPAPPPDNDWVYSKNGPNNWDQSWNARRPPRLGACFYTSAGFRGNRFCVRRGDRLDRLPGNFGDNISSIQVFGRTRVQVFNDRGFRGGSQVFRGSVDDLRRARFRGGHTWNNRISSIAVS